MTDIPGEGFELGSAYVQVNPDAGDFQGELESQIGEINFVVQIPVVPDAGDFAGEVDAAVAESKAAVAVPVVPDTGGFQLLIDDAVAQAKATVEVPVVPDMAGFAAQAEEGAAAAGEAAGASFDEKLAAALAKVPPVPWPEAEAEAGAAGDAAGSAFGSAFDDSLLPKLSSLLTGATGSIVSDAGAVGTEAGAGFGEAFAAAAGRVTAPLAELAPVAEAEAAGAGEAAGTSFGSRFAAVAGTEGAAGGLAAGEGFASSLKEVITGTISPMEALLGVGFVAAAADMASNFQSAMERIHTQAGVAQSAISGLSGGVLDLAGKVGQSPDSLAAALYHVESSFASVGITGQKAMSLLQISAEGARVGNSNLVDTTNALDAVIASGIGGIKNYSQAMGELNAIVGAGDMTMQDLANAMGSGLMAVAKSYGQSITEVGAALATFGDNNIRGARAATDLRMAWQAIQAPMKGGEAVLNSLGLQMNTLSDTMTHHGMTAAIQQFVDHLKSSHVPISEWGQYVTEIFGKRAGVGIGVMVDQLDRLKSKFPDLQHGASDFGNAWAATQATMKQHLHELEAGFQTLMIKIGNGLLPAVNSFMAMIVRNLPAIEHFGTEIAHLVAPFVTAFFTGLDAILKVLLGPLKDVTIAIAGVGVALAAISLINPWVALIAGLITLVGLIIKYHQQIWNTIKGTWDKVSAFFKKFWPEIAVGALVAFGPIVTGMIALAAVIIKYHKQILDAIEKTWDAASKFVVKVFDDIVKAVTKTFDDIKRAVTSGFDAWWKSHGQEIEQVWNTAWDGIKGAFTVVWDTIVQTATTAWSELMDVLKPGLDLLGVLFKTTWDAIELIFKTAWDAIAAALKIALAGIESVIKIAWDVIVGIFNVALDLVTGHWSKAWTDLKTTAEQVWNAIKEYFSQVWNAIKSEVEQVVNNLKAFFVQAWDDVKSGVTSAFNDVRNTIKNIWDGIYNDIVGVINKIKSVVGGILGGAGHLVSSALGAIGIHLAGGGVLPGYAPGHDSINARLSPGEAVLVPEAVRAIGPDRINAINAHYSAGRRGYSDGGIIPGYADGGITPYQSGQAAGRMYGGYGSERITGSAAGATFILQFNGTQWPTPEQQQAMMMQLSALVGVS
jgi:TP901 family phage tail tape measure protein